MLHTPLEKVRNPIAKLHATLITLHRKLEIKILMQDNKDKCVKNTTVHLIWNSQQLTIAVNFW